VDKDPQRGDGRATSIGGLGKLLISNGYDFDLLNDDVLQNRATLKNGSNVRDLDYSVLVLPNLEAIPLTP
jgi:hypothetical protein